MSVDIIGREREVEALHAALDGIGAVAVIGPAGIGKSALVSVALADIDYLAGASLPTMRAMAYFPLEVAIRQRLDGGSTGDVVRQVLQVAEGRTLVVEDIHWSDADTLAALEALRGRLPMVVTARSEQAGMVRDNLVRRCHQLVVGPLDLAASRRVVASRWPLLPPSRVSELIKLAEGSPLLLEYLPTSDGDLAVSAQAAFEQRLLAQPDGVLDALGRLALRGIPSDPAMIGLEHTATSTGIVAESGDGVWFCHGLLADATVDLIAGNTARIHRDLADRVPAEEAANHLLAAGEYGDALTRALSVAHASEGITRARQLEFAVRASEALGTGHDELRLEAAKALIEAQRFPEAIEIAAGVEADEPDARALGLMYTGRAQWLLGDVGASERSFSAAQTCAKSASTEVAVRVDLELAYLHVRDRRAGSLEIAERAADLSKRTGMHTLIGQCTLGAAQLYDQDPRWESTLRAVVHAATTENASEVQLNAAWHLASGLGFSARLRESNEVNRLQSEYSRRSGSQIWKSHFDAARMLTSTFLGETQAEVVETAKAFLADRRPFRNQAQVWMALVLCSSDLGQRDEAHAAAGKLTSTATTPEDHVWAAFVSAELAWIDGDREAMRTAVERSRRHGDAWFGLRLVVETAAVHLATDIDDVDFVPDPPGNSLPVFWPAVHDLEAYAHYRRGDVLGAANALGRAHTAWTAHECARLAVRSKFTQSTCLERAGKRPAAAAARREATEQARRHNLHAHLGRLDSSVQHGLTRRELEVLGLVAHGMSSPQIARRLELSRNTVDAYVGSACLKLGASTRLEASLMATRGTPS